MSSCRNRGSRQCAGPRARLPIASGAPLYRPRSRDRTQAIARLRAPKTVEQSTHPSADVGCSICKQRLASAAKRWYQTRDEVASLEPDRNPDGTTVTLRRRVLLAEDDEDVRSVFEIVLAENYDLRTAASGEETISIAQDWQPDVLLLDWTLPDATGEEIVERLRARGSGCAALPIVVVSGDATVKEIARRIGAVACPKPCAVDQLMIAIERALEVPRRA